MRPYTIAPLAALILAFGLSAEVQKKDVDIKAPDGVSLKGTYLSPDKPGPAMLLLHQCDMDRHAWDSLASDLAGAGFHVLEFDFRGNGESGGDRPTEAAARRAEQQKWPADIDAAYAFLIAQKGVDSAHVVAGGSACAVGQVTDLATRNHQIKALLLLSGSAGADAKTYIAATPGLPVFGAAAQGDTNAAKGIQETVESSKNPNSTFKIYPGKEHGVPLFGKNAELEPMIVTWLKARAAQ
jgi:dienelactone hydrolase